VNRHHYEDTNNVQQEADREDMKHHATMLLYKGELHHAPIGSDPHKILDVGTGTGNTYIPYWS